MSELSVIQTHRFLDMVGVVGSSPIAPTNKKPGFRKVSGFFLWRLAVSLAPYPRSTRHSHQRQAQREHRSGRILTARCEDVAAQQAGLLARDRQAQARALGGARRRAVAAQQNKQLPPSDTGSQDMFATETASAEASPPARSAKAKKSQSR